MAKVKTKTKAIVSKAVPGVKVTRKGAVLWLLICVVIGVGGVVGFLGWQEWNKKAAADEPVVFKTPPPDFKQFNNDYWGFKFYYPGTWSRVTGQVKDSEFYFASEPIDFLSELSSTEVAFGVKTYNNYQKLPWDAWLAYHDRMYVPGKVIHHESVEFLGLPAERYDAVLQKPEGVIAYTQMIVVSKNEATKLQLLMEAKDKETLERFSKVFKEMLSSVTLYKGFGEEL